MDLLLYVQTMMLMSQEEMIVVVLAGASSSVPVANYLKTEDRSSMENCTNVDGDGRYSFVQSVLGYC